MTPPLLLDTCAVIWLAEGQDLAESAKPALEEVYQTGGAVYVSPISAWEIGMLISRGRLSLVVTSELWFQKLFDVLDFRLAEMPPEVLIGSSFLPGRPPRDPADRIMAATAREYGYVLLTRDRPLLDYAELGHIQAIAC